MNYYEALRIKALRDVRKPEGDYYIRKIMRWYSKTFFTPLHEVANLPIEEVIRCFYEERYESMSEEEIDNEIEDLLKTEEQKKKERMAQEEEMATEWELMELSEKHNKKSEPKKMADLDKNIIPKQFADISQTLKDASDEMQKVAEEFPEIDVDFVSNEDFSKMIDGYGEMGIKK